MNAFFNWLCNPISIFIVLLSVAVIFHFTKKEKVAFAIFVAGIVWVLLSCASPLPQWVVQSLESQYPPFDHKKFAGQDPVYILVLGGGYTGYEMPSSIRFFGKASVRLAEGLTIHRQIKNSKLVGSGSSLSKALVENDTLGIDAIELYVDENSGSQKREPQNTAEEIKAYSKNFVTDATLVLVTSAVHMPRAMMLCKKNGLQPIPAPAGFFVAKNKPYDFKPSTKKLEMMESALHEYAGLAKAVFIE